MSNLPEVFFQNIEWSSEKNPIWISSTLHLYRNLALYKFPDKMSSTEMIGSLKTLFDTFRKTPLTQTFYLLPAETLSLLDKEILFEHFYCTQGFQEASAGQGFALDLEGKTFITCHVNNHLQFHTVENTENLIQAWGRLSQLEEEFGSSQLYAFSPRFGYLTANPMCCGTAFEARLFLHVPALRHSGALEPFLQTQHDDQLQALSLEGPLSDLVGDILILKNRYTLGVSEEATLVLLKTAASKMALAEKTAREALKAKASPQIKDFIGRSFGLLMHSYQLYPKETLDALSALSLGAEIGLISGLSYQQIHTLMLQLQRGHLSHLLHLDTMDPEPLSHKRAEWLHQELKAAILKDA